MGKLITKKDKDEDEETLLEKAMKRDKNYFTIELTKELVEKFDAKVFNDTLYVKGKNNIYYCNSDVIEDIISSEYELTSIQYRELIYQIRKKAKKVDSFDGFKLRNGYLIMINGKYKFKPLADGSFCPYYIDVEYNKDSKDEYVDKFLHDISSNNEDKFNTLIEVMGSIILIENSPCKIFYLYGKGSNGKSTFTSMLRNFLGEYLTSNISIDGLNDDTQLGYLAGKLLNVSDDADFNIIQLNKASRMKSICSYETLTYRPIYSQPKTHKFFCKLIVSCNNLPLFADKSYGLSRRLVIIDFSKTIKKEEKIANMTALLSTDSAKSAILNYIIKGANQIITNNYELTDTEINKKILEEYLDESDNVRSFIKDRNINGKSVSEVYKNYKDYCDKDICSEPIGKNGFGARLKLYGYVSKVKTEKKDGKKTSERVYIYVGDSQ